MSANIKNSNQSVGKAMQIIEFLTLTGPMRLQDISKAVEMPASTALRMISALMEYGYIYQDQDNLKYALTLKFSKIGSIVSSRFSLRNVAHPYLLDLSEKCKEAASIAIEDQMQSIYIDVVDGTDGMLKITQYIGKQAPMHCTGVGKCLLLNYTEKQIDDLVQTKGLTFYTPNTITTKKALLEELNVIRTRGYALDDQECELGARCVATSVKDYTGKVVAALSVSGPFNRMTYEYMETISCVVMKAAMELSRALSYVDEA